MSGGLTLLVCCVLAAFASGCGGGESAPAGDAGRTAATTNARTQAQRQPASEPKTVEDIDTVHGLAPNPWREPSARSVGKHPGFRLDRVVVRELTRGRGPAVRAHDIVFVDYIEADYRRATEIYRSWGGGYYATAGVILAPRERWRGMLAGMKGMRPGGRRQILAPPRLGGIEPRHADYGNVVYWDVVLRKILARGCSDDGLRCRSVAP